MTKQKTSGTVLIEEMENITVKDPNDPFVNHWKDPDKIGFNRDLKPKLIHESFKDLDGQGSNSIVHFSDNLTLCIQSFL